MRTKLKIAVEIPDKSGKNLHSSRVEITRKCRHFSEINMQVPRFDRFQNHACAHIKSKRATRLYSYMGGILRINVLYVESILETTVAAAVVSD